MWNGKCDDDYEEDFYVHHEVRVRIVKKFEGSFFYDQIAAANERLLSFYHLWRIINSWRHLVPTSYFLSWRLVLIGLNQ